MASAGPLSGAPAARHARAWKGFAVERGSTGSSTGPRLSATAPDASSPTTLPKCLLSTKPDLVTSASGTCTSGLQVAGELGRRRVRHEVDQSRVETGQRFTAWPARP